MRLPRRDTLGCSFFFFLMGSFYAQLMSRMPAMKEILSMGDEAMGAALGFFGGGSLVGLFLCPLLLRRFTSKVLLSVASILLLSLLPLAGFCQDFVCFCPLLGMVGIACGCFDVCMNTQGVLQERVLKQSRMGLFQACYSAGGLLGALFSFLCVEWALAPSMHFLAYSSVGLLGLPLACPSLHGERRGSQGRLKGSRIPLFVVFCGVMELGFFVSSGCVEDWGSVLLRSCKGASESVAALAVGAASLPMILIRLSCDSLRTRIGDFPLLFCGTLIGASGLALAIFSTSPILTLLGFVLVGLGLGPGVPILMSHAGNIPGVPSGAACAVVSSIGCSGLLFFPPMLGGLSGVFGLERAMILPLCICLLASLGSFCFCGKVILGKDDS